MPATVIVHLQDSHSTASPKPEQADLPVAADYNTGSLTHSIKKKNTMIIKSTTILLVIVLVVIVPGGHSLIL